MNIMKKFKLYQIHTTKEEDDLINAEGHDAVPKHKMHLDMTFRKQEDTGAIAKQAFDLGYYSHVSNIIAKSFEGVFSVGNMGPESQIERFADCSMYSVSVGDIVEDEDGNKSVVAGMGFKEVA